MCCRYVVEKDTQNNVVFVSRNYFSLEKRRRSFRVGSLKWISGSPPEKYDKLRCKVRMHLIIEFMSGTDQTAEIISFVLNHYQVRHGPGFYDCSITLQPSDLIKDDVAIVHLSADDQGLASGQFAAFYRDEICVGSGVILDSADDKNFPVCAKALEIARMDDKSKLGKPVKIINQDISIKEVENSSVKCYLSSEDSKLQQN